MSDYFHRQMEIDRIETRKDWSPPLLLPPDFLFLHTSHVENTPLFAFYSKRSFVWPIPIKFYLSVHHFHWLIPFSSFLNVIFICCLSHPISFTPLFLHGLSPLLISFVLTNIWNHLPDSGLFNSQQLPVVLCYCLKKQ